MKSFYASTAILSFLLPSVSLASEQFATVDTFRINEGTAIITSLSVGSEITYSDDGFYELAGFVVVPDKEIRLPLTVRVRTVSPEEPPAVTNFVEGLERVTLSASHSEGAGLTDLEVNKIFYTLQFEDESHGFVTVTEDPLPAIAWVAIAGIASVTTIAVSLIFTCEGRLSVETGHEVTADGGAKSSLKGGCDPT